MKIDEFLSSRGVSFQRLHHRPAYTANHVAEALHVPGQEMAKTVLVRAGRGYALAVLPATHRVDLDRLRQELGEERVGLATEGEMERLFPDCERGAVPPFGSLYHLPTLVDHCTASCTVTSLTGNLTGFGEAQPADGGIVGYMEGNCTVMYCASTCSITPQNTRTTPSATASTCRKGVASGSTSGGALMSSSSGSAATTVTSATPRPIQVLAPSPARATASAWSRRPAPRFCVMTTLTPMPTTRNRMNSAAIRWLASENAPAAVSESRAASHSPTAPTVMPSRNSAKMGQAMPNK